MKKIAISIIIAAMIAGSTQAFCSCSNDSAKGDTITLAANQKMALVEIYRYSCEYLSIDSTAETYDEMIQVIRVADIKDESGDVIAEIPEYDDIKTIIWPKGYRKF